MLAHGVSRGKAAKTEKSPRRGRQICGVWLLASAALLPGQGRPPLAFHVASTDQGAWGRILASAGFHGVNFPPAVRLRLQIVEGRSPQAEALGFHVTGRRVRVASVEDVHNPEMPIVWARAVELPVFEVPRDAQVFARARNGGAPLGGRSPPRRQCRAVDRARAGRAGLRAFPYLPQALADLGLEPDVVSRRLWAFFDSSYRLRVDLDYFARQWRRAGISALHVAAWHFFEPSAEGDEYLRRLIEACHRQGILVYAWFELPHVSETFWNQHPEWREKTATLQDAHLDWRKLMNLANRDCFGAVSGGVRQLIQRFDWDGVNLAELYFESLQGQANPAHFTPMNDDVRAEFRQQHGADPLELFRRPSPDGMRTFLDFRTGLARRIESEWMSEIDLMRRDKPDLDLVLTHVDDRLDATMRDAIGVDSSLLASKLNQDFSLLIEDPATVWHLGPDRYKELAQRYQPLALPAGKLAVDINIVERYQDVYPTKQQTGVELFELVHQASQAFPRVALYFENSILAPDLPLLAASSAVVNRIENTGARLAVDAPRGFGIRWKGPARLDGQPWPAMSDDVLWVPAGNHQIEASAEAPPIRLIDFNGDLKTARSLPHGLEFSYESTARAMAMLDKKPASVEVDDSPLSALSSQQDERVVTLPRGGHRVRVLVAE